MKHIKNYFEVVESVSGWRVYNIPTSTCPTEESALELVEELNAFDFLVDDEYDSTSIESIELITEE